ncbi:OmpA family protein [Flavobacterium channae]|uniref:OmpA family protein n=1 Tax=Flavobacterium channae TaxID=2897181 RepID=UPI001E3775CD|nr:OmpA family protein [Flavobacterium channae]UGS23120.1 OmpA family protein [Flavobacterium channae]
MRFNFTLFTFLLFSLFGYSQTVLFQDEFEDNKSNLIFNGDSFEAKIEKGKLVLENNHATNSKWRYISITQNTDLVDFDIETEITMTKTPTEYATYGLVWGMYSDNSDYRVVQLSANKQSQIYHYYAKEFHYNKKWSASKNVEGKGRKNKIRLEKRANVYKVYLNGNLEFQTGDNAYYGSSFGFIIDSGVHIEVENLKITEVPFSVNVVKEFNSNLKMLKLPETVSSPTIEETNPVISADGNILYFDRKNNPANVETDKDDIWYSVKDRNGKWQEAKNAGRPINNKDYNFVISTSPDNNTLLLGNRYAADGVSPNGAGVSIAKKGDSGWEIPKDVIIDDYKNTNDHVGYFLTSDNKYLLMSVERPEGLGLKDLYVSSVKEDGTFSKPKSLGNVINTFDDEANPFLAADGKTLYFASKGHPGYGYYDLFVSKRLDDSWTNWSKPENLGNIINSTGYELSIFLSAKGDKAYVGREKDIWEIDNTVKQDPVALVKGKVYDSKTKKVMSAPIVYNALKTNKELGTAVSDPSTGSYSIVLPYGEKYSFMAEKEGYYAVTQNVDLSDLKEYKEIEVDLYLNPIEKGEIIRLNNIFFASGKYELLAESYGELDKLLQVLKSNSKMKIEISGHTDAVGADADNLTLSNNRANAVMNYLLGKGIAKDRLSAKGYGETKFIATNDTDEGKQLNRRVEFVILEK